MIQNSTPCQNNPAATTTSNIKYRNFTPAMFHVKLEMVVFIFVCEVVFRTEGLFSHIGRLVAAGIDAFREQLSRLFGLHEVVFYLVPSKKDFFCRTPDSSLYHNGVENVNWILDTNDKTLISDGTSNTGVEAETENWSQVDEEEESRTVGDAVIFDSSIEQVRYSMSLLCWRVPWAQGKMTLSVSHRPTVFMRHYREMNGTSPPTYSKQRQDN